MMYEPIEATVYGRKENRIKPLSVLHVPLKAGNTLDTIDDSPQMFIVGTDLIYYVDGNFYSIGGGSTGRFGLEDATQAEERAFNASTYRFTWHGVHVAGGEAMLELHNTSSSVNANVLKITSDGNYPSTAITVLCTNSTGLYVNGLFPIVAVSTNGLPISASQFGNNYCAQFDTYTNSYPPVVINNNYSGAANDVAPTILFERIINSGVPVGGLGAAFDFVISTWNGSSILSGEAGQLQCYWVDANHSTRQSAVAISGVDAGVLSRSLTLRGDGLAQLNHYGVGTFVGSVAKVLAVTSGGNIIEVDSSSIGGTGSRFATVATVAALNLLSNANYDYAILHQTSFPTASDYYNNTDGTYKWDASSGDYSALGGGFWKRVQALPAWDGHHSMQNTFHQWIKDTSGPGGAYSSSKPPIAMFIRNDNGESANASSMGTMICGSAYGGAINFVNDFSTSANRMLQLGLVDNSMNFTNMLEMHYSSGGNSIIQRAPLTPATATTQSIGSSALPFATAFFGGLAMGYVTKAVNYTTTVNDFAIDANALGVGFNITLGSSLATGKIQLIRKTDSSANVVTVVGTINGVSNYPLSAQYQFVMVQYNGTNWNIISAGIVSGGGNVIDTLDSTLTAGKIASSINNDYILLATPNSTTSFSPYANAPAYMLSGDVAKTGCALQMCSNTSVSTGGALKLGVGAGSNFFMDLLNGYYYAFDGIVTAYSRDGNGKYAARVSFGASYNGTSVTFSAVTTTVIENTGIFASGTTITTSSSGASIAVWINDSDINGTNANANQVKGTGVFNVVWSNPN